MIDIGIGADTAKESCRYLICNWYYFLKINSRFQPKACDGCHNLMQVTMSFDNVTVAFVSGNDYIIHFWYMSKDEAINIMKKPE